MADPLLHLGHDISAAFENCKFVFAIFFDLQKLGNVGFCVNSFLLVFVDIYLSSSDIFVDKSHLLCLSWGDPLLVF